MLAGCTIAAKCCKNHMLYHNSHADEDKLATHQIGGRPRNR